MTAYLQFVGVIQIFIWRVSMREGQVSQRSVGSYSCIQGSVPDAGNQCSAQQEPVRHWDIYSTTVASPAAFAVSPHIINICSCVQISNISFIILNMLFTFIHSLKIYFLGKICQDVLLSFFFYMAFFFQADVI